MRSRKPRAGWLPSWWIQWMDANRCGDRGAMPSPVRYRMAVSIQLQTEMNVDGAGGMGDSAHRNEVRAGFGVGAYGLERDAARKLYSCALVDNENPLFGFFGTEIIEQKFFRAGRQSFIEFGAGANLNLHRQQRVLDRGERGANAPRGGAVIVLDQHRGVQSHAM